MMCGKGVNQAKELHLQQSQPGMVKALKRLSPLREHERKRCGPDWSSGPRISGICLLDTKDIRDAWSGYSLGASPDGGSEVSGVSAFGFLLNRHTTSATRTTTIAM